MKRKRLTELEVVRGKLQAPLQAYPLEVIQLLQEKMEEANGKDYIFTEHGRFIWCKDKWKKDTSNQIKLIAWKMLENICKEKGIQIESVMNATP